MALSQNARFILLQLVERATAGARRRPAAGPLLRKCGKQLARFKALQLRALEDYYNNEMLHTFELMKNKLALCYFPNVEVRGGAGLEEADVRAFAAQLAAVQRDPWNPPAEDEVHAEIDAFLEDSASWKSYQARVDAQVEALRATLDRLYASYEEFLRETVQRMSFPFRIDDHL